jgi:hypothetical protein
MMPTFPRPSRSFRTAGFPQYGWKAGLSDSAFPDQHQVKPAPGIPRRQSGLCQTKGAAPARRHLNHRATSRLYTVAAGTLTRGR